MAADFVRHARTLSILTIVSRVTGLGRDMALAAAFGLSGVMNSWVPAFVLPNLFRTLFGEGALTTTFLPVYTRLVEKKEEEAARQLAGSVCREPPRNIRHLSADDSHALPSVGAPS